MSAPASHFIAVDWGSTNARAFLFNRDGRVLERRPSALGVKNVPAGGHRRAFDELTGDWRAQVGDVPVFLSGMIGSRHGWHEAPYLACPVPLAQLAQALVPVPTLPHVRIIPGLRTGGARPDVMRGEELQLLGLGHDAAACEFVCLPGTHAKWIETKEGVVRDFHTAMTGEVFAAITEHTLFASLLENARGSTPNLEAFSAGIQRSATPHGLLHALFELRAGTLLGQLQVASLQDLLSGLLIGTELRHMQPRLRPGARVAILGATGLAERYAHGLRVLGFEPVAFDAETTTARGFAELFRLWAR